MRKYSAAGMSSRGWREASMFHLRQAPMASVSANARASQREWNTGSFFS